MTKEGRGGDAGHQEVDDDVPPVVSNNPPPPEEPCAPQKPAPGSSCASEGQDCLYAGSCVPTSIPRFVMKCREGAWHESVESFCNPPAPVTCPPERPIYGAECQMLADGGSLECHYLIHDCPYVPPYDGVARCEANKWNLPIGSCNPPAPPCLADGGTCDGEPGSVEDAAAEAATD